MPSCSTTDAEKKQNDITVDFGFLEDIAYEYAARFHHLPQNELIRQGFLLDVRARIDRLYYEVSATHAKIFERAFADSAGIEPKI